ncbi:MAG: type VI secretion system baseplate subunit TssF [Phycisphaerae bacterium]
MDNRLLRYYNRELGHLREMGAEFAREFPKIAGRLGLEEFACADPYVERLLEGFAFLASRVQLKLDAEFPRFAQSVLETVYPHYLAPMPSMAVVQFQPEQAEGALAEGFTIPRDAALRGALGKGEQTACEYRTAHDVTLWPIQITEAQYHTRDLGALGLPPGTAAKAGIRIRIAPTPGMTLDQIKCDSLCLYIRAMGHIQMRLYEQIIGQAHQVLIQPAAKPPPWREVVPAARGVAQAGFSPQEALLPYTPRSFQGYRLLQEYFAFPQRFLFFELRGLRAAFARAVSGPVDVIILTRGIDLELENAVEPANFAPFCTPAINLFHKRCDRIHLTDRFSEYQVIPDRTRPLDFEVYQVRGVTGFGSRSGQEMEFLPFYSAKDYASASGEAGAYFAVNRVPRTESERERKFGRRSSYPGSEVYLTIVDAKSAPWSADLKQLGISALCTNRDLPLQMPVGQGRTDFTMEASAPVESVRVVGGPTPPRPSHVEGEITWRMISHFSLNYLSLVNSDQAEGAAALRDIMRLYGQMSDPQTVKQIDGVKSIASRPISRRVATPGPIAFARGLELTLAFDEAAFEGSGVFLLGAVLEQFFARYVSLNSFTETVVRTLGRGEIMRWPSRMGTRPLL